MTAPTPTAATPEELAARAIDELNASFNFQDSHIPVAGDDDWPPNPGVVAIIAAAIRQHSEPLRAEIERLTKERDAFRDTGKAFVEKLGARLVSANDALSASQERERAMREALEREAAWNEAEAAICDQQAGAARTGSATPNKPFFEGAAHTHRKAARRLSAALQQQETADAHRD